MIGIFDSGVGGLCALREVQRLQPKTDICYLADRANAPFGIKDRKSICEITGNNIKRLRDMGADEILIACCTACTVYPLLPPELKEGVHTIIASAARVACEATRRGHILVISTHATAQSGAFAEQIRAIAPEITVEAYPSARLVQVVESGARDGKMDEGHRRIIHEELSCVCSSEADTVILGCTHFSHISNEIGEYLGMLPISAADEGARELCRTARRVESGKVSYIGT